MSLAPNNDASRALQSLIARDPGAFAVDQRRLSGALADLCPALTTERSVLVSLLKEGLPSQLMAANQAESIEPLDRRCSAAVARAGERAGLSPTWAAWGGVSWAKALGVELDLDAVLRPHVLSFEADPDPEAGAVRLRWDVIGQPELLLQPVGISVTGRDEIEIDQDEARVEYVLRATNPAGRAEARLRVELPAAAIVSFGPNQQIRTKAGAAVLNWTVRNAAAVELDGEPVGAPPHTVDVPAEGAEFTLTARGGGREAQATCRVDVAAFERLEPVIKGGRTAIEWRARHVDHVVVEGVGRFPAEGSCQVEVPPRGAKFTVRGITTRGGAVKKTLAAKPPSIKSFSADPGFAFVGTDVELRWRATNADRVTLTGAGEVTGKRVVRVPARSDGRYTLRAEGPWGTAERTVEVDVRRRPAAPTTPLVRVRSEPPAFDPPTFQGPFRGGPGVVQLADRVEQLLAAPSPRTPAHAFELAFRAARGRVAASLRSLRGRHSQR